MPARRSKESPVPAGKISPQLRNVMVRNIVNTYDAATPRQQREGEEWYEGAHMAAQSVGRHLQGYTTQHEATVAGAGIIAALSPQTGWERNVANAHAYAKDTNAKVTQTTTQTNKAQRILLGEHPLDVLHGMKERSFYQNIADPSDPNPVTIDRHAHDIAAGRKNDSNNGRGLQTPSRYDNFADAYHAAAHHLGIPVANQVQAATWVHWTEAYGSKHASTVNPRLRQTGLQAVRGPRQRP